MFLQSSLVSSYLPFTISFFIFNLFFNILMFLIYKMKFQFYISCCMFFFLMILWFRDLTRESLYEGYYNLMMQKSFKISMIFFIFSELMFFFSIFWSYFHFSFMFSGELGFQWPSFNLEPFNMYSIPLLNTLLLLSSGWTMTMSHSLKMSSELVLFKKYLMMTIVLGIIFMVCQSIEYYTAELLWSDSSFGSIFFLITGFHGLHVIIGLIMMITNYSMSYFKIFNNKFIMFDMISWYWHFVDVVWLMLFLFVYWWIK